MSLCRTVFQEAQSAQSLSLNTLINSEPKSFREELEPLLVKLEIILDKFLNNEDALSCRLFDWGVGALTLAELNEDDENLRESAAVFLPSLKEELFLTQIQCLAKEAELPVEIRVHDFAGEMFFWLREVQELVGESNGLKSTSVRELDFSVFSKPMAMVMYQLLFGKAKSVDEQRLLRISIEDHTKRLSEFSGFLKEQIQKQKAIIEKNIYEHEKLISEKICLMEERHRLEIQALDTRISNLAFQLTDSERSLQDQQAMILSDHTRIRQLISKQELLQDQVRRLESEVDSGGCVIL